MRRQWVGRVADHPIAGHPEVDVERAAVVEAEQLVLSTPLDADDGAADERGGIAGGQAARERGMPWLDGAQTMPDERRPDTSSRVFDLRLLGHARWVGEM